MKIGLDLHGTIDLNPQLFVRFAKQGLTDGSEIHIITGIRFTPAVEKELLSYNGGEKWWTHFFSITQYLLDKGCLYTVVGEGDDARYTFDALTWDTVKAKYCLENDIDMHIDDSPRYLEHFTTPSMSTEEFINLSLHVED